MKVIIEDDYLAQLVIDYPLTLGKRKFPTEVEKRFAARVSQLAAASNENDLRAIKSLHLEKLKGAYKDKYSVRVNKAWRIIFFINEHEHFQ